MGYGLGRENAESRAAARTVLLASSDVHLRTRLSQELTAMRWKVREASGGAEAMALLETQGAEALVLDSFLPDLEVGEFASEMRTRHPAMDLLRIDGIVHEAATRSPRRNELLHALRQAQEDAHGAGGTGGCAPWALAPLSVPHISAADRLAPTDERMAAAREVAELIRQRNAPQPDIDHRAAGAESDSMETVGLESNSLQPGSPAQVSPETSGKKMVGPRVVAAAVAELDPAGRAAPARNQIAETNRPLAIFDRQSLASRPLVLPLPEMVGESRGMMELARLVRLVAPRSSTVLIEGETGTGKELVARAVHLLSPRAGKPFVVLNCAAIPESLLEAELFGHTRGAFTGAVQSRTGRIESAHGGTLFLDEIGEMPLSLQAKMLRFLESGELQRVGDNETVRVEARVVAATHEPLQQRAGEHLFRLDLYHRLAVFPVLVPALRERMEDVLPLAAHLLARLGQEMPVKRLSPAAATRLMKHDWPGNVRELSHVLERATIMAEDRREIARDEIRL